MKPSIRGFFELLNPPERNESRNDERSNAGRSLAVLSHGFELALILVIAFTSLVLIVPAGKVILTFFETLATISLVHCIDTARTINERISRLGEYMWQAYELGCPSVARSYRNALNCAKIDRGWFLVMTVMTATLWFTMSVCYASFMARTSNHNSSATINSSAPEQHKEDVATPKSTHVDQSLLEKSSAFAVSLFSSTGFLHAWVVFCGIVSFCVALAKVSAVSKLDPLSMQNFLNQVLFELQSKSDPNLRKDLPTAFVEAIEQFQSSTGTESVAASVAKSAGELNTMRQEGQNG